MRHLVLGSSLGVFLAFLGLTIPAVAAAHCADSATGAHSVDVSLSPLSGRMCLEAVVVHTGPGCGGPRAWSITLGCDETRRMVVTDAGRLVSLLTPRVNRRSWAIIRTFSLVDGHAEVRSIRLDDLPDQPPGEPRPRLRIDARVLHIEGSPPVTVPVQTIHTLGRRTARRRARAG